MSYPKWLYHAEKEARIVQDEAAHKALGAEWVESPAAFEKKAPEALGDAVPEVEAQEGAHDITEGEPHAPKRKPGRKPKTEAQA